MGNDNTDIAKKLSPSQEKEYNAETKLIAENRKKPEARQPHRFKAAKFTFPNGHPRCLICGQEEMLSGWCNSPKRDRAASDDYMHGRWDVDKPREATVNRYANIAAKSDDPTEGNFRIIEQTWTSDDQVLRRSWHLLAKTDEKKYAWTFDHNPMLHETCLAKARKQSQADWAVLGDITADCVVAKSDLASPSTVIEKDSGPAVIEQTEEAITVVADTFAMAFEIEKATWSTAYKNDLPDGAFLYIESGGEKDDEGKTVPRTLRHFPVKDHTGKLDPPHLRNAIARIPTAKIPLDADGKTKLQERARELLAETKKSADEKYWIGTTIKDEQATYLVMVLDKELADPATTPRLTNRKWLYHCGLATKEGEEWQNTTRFHQRPWVYIGKTQPSEIRAKPGDVLAVRATMKIGNGKRTILMVNGSVTSLSEGSANLASEVVGANTTKSVEMKVVPIGKGDDFQGYFYGMVMKPNDGVDGPLEPDTQDDAQNAAEILDAIHFYGEKGHQGDVVHAVPAQGEMEWISIRDEIAPLDFWLLPDGETAAPEQDWRKEKLIPPVEHARFMPKGTWLKEGKALGKKVRAMLQNGELGGLSIEGLGTRRPLKP